MKKIICLIIPVLLVALLLGCANKTTEGLDELLELGNKYLMEEDYENAVVAFEEAIKIDKKCIEAYIGAADGYLGLEKPEKAIKILESAVKVDDQQAAVYLKLAEVYASAGQEDKAMEILDKGIEATDSEELWDYKARVESGSASGSEQDKLSRANTSETINHEDGSTSVFEYGNKGNLIKATYTNPDGSYQVDEYKGNEDAPIDNTCTLYRIKTSHYDTNGNYDQGYIYENDNEGRCIKCTWEYYDSSGTYCNGNATTYEYDKKGRVIKENRYYYGELFGWQIMEYDKKGNNTKTTDYREDGTLNWYQIYEYDKEGNYIDSPIYNADGSLKQ